MKTTIDEATFRSYVHQRITFPEVAPERWATIFENVPEMEERYLKTFILKLMEVAEEIEVADLLEGNTPIHQLGNEQVGTGGEVSAKTSPPKDSEYGAALDENNICPMCCRDYEGHVQTDGVKFCTADDCPSHPRYRDLYSLPVHPSGDKEGGDSGHESPLSFIEKEIENLTRSVIDAEMRAGFKRNISVSSELDPVYGANGRY